MMAYLISAVTSITSIDPLTIIYTVAATLVALIAIGTAAGKVLSGTVEKIVRREVKEQVTPGLENLTERLDAALSRLIDTIDRIEERSQRNETDLAYLKGKVESTVAIIPHPIPAPSTTDS